MMENDDLESLSRKMEETLADITERLAKNRERIEQLSVDVDFWNIIVKNSETEKDINE